ncbi:glycosyltransferase family 2 protein [Butyrivibrio sp. MC2013]|uniref:glycosyltransferase family 2 protein n=1 Tax=Butyrivibrio sp. MC2013 TaxID=1280686 RepID=UPI000411B399|nr:glycosyltransferase family 2 protein [Butyrivibrio sp. MC2013]
MADKPKISLIIPVYNTAAYLPRCMDSVLASSMEDLEIVLVDDGSTDGISPSVCDDYAGRDNRIKVIHKENGGLQSAWIRGVRESSAPYICFIDSDDWLDSEIFTELYKLTSGIDSEIISSGYIIEKASERKYEYNGLPKGEYTGSALTELRSRLLGEKKRPVIMSRCMKLISRPLIENNLHYCNDKIRLGEDVNIMLPALCDATRLVISRKAYYHYRTVEGSMARAYSEKVIDEIRLLCSVCNNILTDKNIDNADYQTGREYLRLIFVYLKGALRAPGNEHIPSVISFLTSSEVTDKLSSYPLDIKGKADKLLYFCLKHPNRPVLGFTRLILSLYDRKTN